MSLFYKIFNLKLPVALLLAASVYVGGCWGSPGPFAAAAKEMKGLKGDINTLVYDAKQGEISRNALVTELQKMSGQFKGVADAMEKVAGALTGVSKNIAEKSAEAIKQSSDSFAQILKKAIEEKGKIEFPLTLESLEKAIKEVSNAIQQISGARVAAERVKAREATKRWRELFGFVKSFTQPKGIVGVGGLIGVGTVAYFGTKMMVSLLKARLLKPPLVDETNRPDWFGRVSKPKGPLRKLSEVRMEPETTSLTSRITSDVGSAIRRKTPLPHMLLWGEPGTGKTMFAKALARQLGVYYAIMHGPDFAKFKERDAIQELDRIVKWAESSDKPVILFIDEMENIFGERKEARQLGKELTDKFLGLVEKPRSSNFCVVLVTNYIEDIDDAVVSRMAYTVEVVKPRQRNRELLLADYLKISAREYKISFANIAGVVKRIPDLAKKMEGFVPRDIEEAAAKMMKEMIFRKSKILTHEMADLSVDLQVKARADRQRKLEEKRRRLKALPLVR
jgi:broad-specificity NMP kinase